LIVFHAIATAEIKDFSVLPPYAGIADRDISVTVGILDKFLASGEIFPLFFRDGVDGLLPRQEEHPGEPVNKIENDDRDNEPENHFFFPQDNFLLLTNQLDRRSIVFV
jgi:hypothetical protein